MILSEFLPRIGLPNHQFYIRLLSLSVVFCLTVCYVSAQASLDALPLRDRIAQQLELVHSAEHQHLPDAQQGNLWFDLAVYYQQATEFSKAEDAYGRAIHLFKSSPSTSSYYAAALDSLGSLYLNYGRLEEAENCRREALTVRQKLGDSLDIARSKAHLADVFLVRRKFKQAEQEASEANQAMVSLSDSHQLDVFSTFVTLTYARCSEGKCAEGLGNAQQAVAIARNYPPGSLPMGFALATLGYAQWKAGATQDAEKNMLDGLKILRAGMVPGDPRVSAALLQYREYLLAMHRKAEARQIQEEVTSMTPPSGSSCQTCVVSVYGLSKALR